MYVGYCSVYVVVVYVVFNSGITSLGESLTLECSSNTTCTYINWYRNNIKVENTERYSSGNCNIFKDIKYTVGRCDQHVHQLIINNVSYTEDNGAHWSCNSTTTTNSFILSVVGTTSATTETTNITSTTEATDNTDTVEPTANAAKTIGSTASTYTTDVTETKSTTVIASTTENTPTTVNSANTANTAITTESTESTTTEQKKTNEGESETNLIIAGSVASVVLVIVVALVVIIVVNKRRKKSTATMEPILIENDLYVSADPGVDAAGNATRNQTSCQADIPEYAKVSETNKSYQPSTEPVIMENDLYKSADSPTTEPIIMENYLYTSADQPTSDPIIMENDLYTSADQFLDTCADCKDIYIYNEGSAHYNSSCEKIINQFRYMVIMVVQSTV